MNTPAESEEQRSTRHLAEDAVLQGEAVRLASRAKTAAEWFDIFVSITTEGVRQGLETQKRGNELKALMDEQKPVFARVRDRFSVQGLELNEQVDVEGPLVQHNVLGMPEVIDWPEGLKATFTWSDASRLVFKGQDALVAVAFIMWWTVFNQVHMQQFGAGPGEAKRRVIDPGSNEYLRYMAAKAQEKDQNPS